MPLMSSNSVQKDIIQAGLAIYDGGSSVGGTKYAKRLRAAELFAKEFHMGVWGTSNVASMIGWHTNAPRDVGFDYPYGEQLTWLYQFVEPQALATDSAKGNCVYQGLATNQLRDGSH